MSQKLIPLFNKDKRVSDLFFDEKTDIVYFLKSIENRKVKFSTKQKRSNLFLARRIANQKLKELLGLKKVKTTPLIKDEIPIWLKIKKAEGLDRKTIQKVEQAIKRIDPFWGSLFAHEISREGVADWFDWLNKEYPGQQKFNAIKYARNFFKYLHEKGLLPGVPKITDPDQKTDLAKRRKKTERIFTEKEFTSIYRAGSETEKLVALFMYTMATRIEETLTLAFDSQVFLDSKLYCWSIGQNKADHEGSADLHASLLPPLKRRLGLCRAARTKLLFPQLHDKQKPLRPQQIDWKDWAKRAGLGWHWTSKTFRHTCLSDLFSNEALPQALICSLYRVSLQTAINTYVKPNRSGRDKIKNAIKVTL